MQIIEIDERISMETNAAYNFPSQSLHFKLHLRKSIAQYTWRTGLEPRVAQHPLAHMPVRRLKLTVGKIVA